ncbi:MAG: hypothetical protein IIA60_14150, partial [Candidatus Marinimicrobia bacterium]|nr:hypothetical protein [Candidatus Neomarinimicrobiota bacterium]
MKGSSIISHALVVVMMLAAPTLARNVETAAGSSWGHSLDKALNHMPVNVAITINNYLIFVDRNSESPLVSGAGIAADYPKGTAGMIFKEGLVWGARVRDGQEPIIRVNGSTYATGLKAGRVLYDGSGKVTDTPVDTSRHVWRVRPDYATADLKADYASSNSVSLTDVTDGDESSIRAQYTYDWANWPGDEGAPYKDVDGNGAYDPAIDIPGWPGADQTLWLVANDIPYFDSLKAGDLDDFPDSTRVDTIEVSPLSYGSPAIGIELQLTMWGYAFAADHPLGNAVFKRARVIYTGLPATPDTAWLDSLYFSQWSDPDLGVYTDDYVGTDVATSLGYIYNGNVIDAVYFGDIGSAVPAAGYDFLQGPIDADGDTLGMSSFTFFGAGSAISDPDRGIYSGTLQWFNLMEGFLPRPEYPEQEPLLDP